MPVLQGSASPYPKVIDVMNLARVRAGDALNDLAGDTLANDQPYTETYLNAAWRKLQVRLANGGVETALREYTLTGFPASDQPSMQCRLSWAGSTSGSASTRTPALPLDLILPLEVWVSSAQSAAGFRMKQASPLPEWADTSVYDWRGDGLYFYGSLYPINMRIRYAGTFQNLSLENADETVPIMFCEDALSWLTVLEYTTTRGGIQGAPVAAMADDAIDQIIQRTGRKNQRRSLYRRPFNRRQRGWF